MNIVYIIFNGIILPGRVVDSYVYDDGCIQVVQTSTIGLDVSRPSNRVFDSYESADFHLKVERLLKIHACDD